MSEDGAFTPRLGRIRDQGGASGKRVKRQLKKAASRLSKAGGRSAFTGARIGSGRAAGSGGLRQTHLSRLRMRRVIVKVHIARMTGRGNGAGRAHVGYLQRDGVDREGEGGMLYDRDTEGINANAFLKRSEGDPHQFRFIVSPEDGDRIGDLKATTRMLMTRMERDLGKRVDWVAVDHHNTGHSHTHIVVRGRDHRMRDVVIARDYLTRGLREAAEEIVTQRLGPRRDLEIAEARAKDVTQERWTAIDRDIEARMNGGVFKSVPAKSERERFDRSLRVSRARHLQSLGLAKSLGAQSWELSPDWREQLKRRGRRGDIIRTLHAGHKKPGGPVRLVEDRDPNAPPVRGTVRAFGPEDELRDTRFLLVEDFEGGIWHVPSSAVDMTAPPPRGAVVELAKASRLARPADQTIAAIAQQTGGIWSDALHAKHDPGAKPEYRLSHKRRLEALRRAGIVQRLTNGDWQIGEDYLARAAAFEAGRSSGVKLTVLSWVSPEQQTGRIAETWLDGLSDDESKRSKRLASLQAARRSFLQEQKLISSSDKGLSVDQRAQLRALELKQQTQSLAARSGRSAARVGAGERFSGKLEGHADLAQGRMAIIGNGKAFVLVPWRPSLGRQLGREITVTRSARGLSWTIDAARQRGLSR